jgi:hypothetical protein
VAEEFEFAFEKIRPCVSFGFGELGVSLEIFISVFKLAVFFDKG